MASLNNRISVDIDNFLLINSIFLEYIDFSLINAEVDFRIVFSYLSQKRSKIRRKPIRCSQRDCSSYCYSSLLSFLPIL